MGPFYCPTDKQIYIDPAFFNELSRRFQAPGDFAQAYVIAHEVGHNIQDLEGTLDKASTAQARSKSWAHEAEVAKRKHDAAIAVPSVVGGIGLLGVATWGIKRARRGY